jgi:P-type E1-E2 ATPase
VLRDNNAFQADPGSRGMSAVFDGHTIIAGRPDFVQEKAGAHHPLPASVQAQIDAMEASHQKPVLIFDSEQGWAVMGFANRLRETAPQTVEALKAMGIEVGIITGSSAAFADEIARQLHIDPAMVHSNATSGEKEAILDRDKAAGKLPGFVGDAINDSEAALKHLSFAVDTGADVTKGSAAVVTRGLESIPPLLRLFKNLNSQIKLMYGGAAGWMTALVASHPFIDMDTGIAAVAHESPTLGLTAWSAGVQPVRNMATFRAERDALLNGTWDEVLAGKAKDQQQTTPPPFPKAG